MSIKLAGLTVIELAGLALSLRGVGNVEATIDLDVGAAPPSGKVQLELAVEGAAVSYTCTILDALPDGDAGRESLGRFRVFAVLGAGGMRRVVEGIDYSDVQPRLILEDIARDTGEDFDLSALGSPSTLARWTRVKGTGRKALERLCARLGLGWRVLPNGRVRVAPETWPAYSATAPQYTAEPDANGVAELALDAPDLAPGMTILRPNNARGAPDV